MGLRSRVAGLAIVGILSTAFAAYWSACSLLIHRSYHSNGWDLGLINQVVWNTAHGRPFEYSFRDVLYAGDHWQPFLVLLAPVSWLGAGPEGLLVVQAIALAAAAIPLYLAARKVGEPRAALAITAAYLLSLGVARAVSFDFHVEAFAPLLAFSALWALTGRRHAAFVCSCLLILTLKEDAALLTLALCWVAWFAFGERRAAAIVAAVSVAYAIAVTSVVIPHFRGDELNPFLERYSYLGGSPIEALFSALVHPDLVASQLLREEALAAAALVLASACLLPLLVPRLLPALAMVVAVPLLSKAPFQGSLELHYFLVPSTVALVLAVVALRVHRASFAVAPANMRMLWPAVLVTVPLALFIALSPLPPSLGADLSRFDVDHHAQVADRVIARVPTSATVSAQSHFVPHMSEREDVYQFPRVLDAQFVLLDDYGPVPAEDSAAGYDACRSLLARLGFDRTFYEDGISLWEKVRPPERVTDAPAQCSGNHP